MSAHGAPVAAFPVGAAAAALVAGVALAAWPLVAGAWGVDFVTKTMIYAILALSLDLLVGTTGLVCFGQAAFFGIGAYAVARVADGAATSSLPGLLAAAMAAAAAWALAVGALVLRTQGAYFIMATLAFAQMAYYAAHDTPLGGGSDGIYLSARPALGPWHELDRPLPLYGITLAALAAVVGLLALLRAAPFGRALAGIRVNEVRMRAAGFSTIPYKLAAFTISGALAGLAGGLFALKDGVVNPELLGWHTSGTALVMIILGGLGRLHGAVIGAFAFALLQELFKSEAIFGAFARHWPLGVGLAIIASVVLLPHGLAGLPQAWRGWRTRAAGRSDAAAHGAVDPAP